MIGAGKFRDNATRYYSKFQILKLPDLFKLETAKFVLSFLHKSLPSAFSNFFTKSCDKLKRATRYIRNQNPLYIPIFHTDRMQRSIKYRGVKLWNSSPLEIHNLPKRAIKI